MKWSLRFAMGGKTKLTSDGSASKIMDVSTQRAMLDGVGFVLAKSAVAGLWWLGCSVGAWLLFPKRWVPAGRLALITVVAIAWVPFVSIHAYMGPSPCATVEAWALLPWWTGTLVGTILEMKRNKPNAQNPASNATSEPAPGAASSAHQG